MCANYRAVTSMDRMLTYFVVERPDDETPPELFPGSLGPFIIRDDQQTEMRRIGRNGMFGMVPHWAKDLAFGRKTYNARSETMAKLPTFRDSWRRGHRCIIPAEEFYEWDWSSGRGARWRILRKDALPMGIAGLWTARKAPDGSLMLSFTMITVNADDHPLMQQFHKPGDEKRMVVILDEADYDAWLACPVDQAEMYIKPYPAELLRTEAWPKDQR